MRSGLSDDPVLLASNVQLYGGFAGTETDRSQRDWATQVTVFDGQDPSATWNHLYRRMERHGIRIHWLDGADLDQARDLVASEAPELTG